MTAWVRRLLAASIVTGTLAGPVHAQTGESVEYYALDAVGSVRVVFDANGTIRGRMDYAPFGGELSGGANLPDQRFAGLFRDGEAGLDYAQARSYQVRTGRFNAPDPVYAGMFDPQQWNRYAYVRNTPLTLVDPTGAQDCPVGSYHCPTVVGPPPWATPGNIQTAPGQWVNIEDRFNPLKYGYQGGTEAAQAEANYVAGVNAVFERQVAAGFAEQAARKPRPVVTTDEQFEIEGANGRQKLEKPTPFVDLTRRVAHNTEPLTRPNVYVEIVLVSAAGRLAIPAVRSVYHVATGVPATPFAVDFVTGFTEGFLAPTPPPLTPAGWGGFFSGWVVNNYVWPWVSKK